MDIDFKHRQSAHCESGVISNLLAHHGIHLSEAMAFGIGTGLFFAYVPFIRVNNLPLTTFRSATGDIIRKNAKHLGVRLLRYRFRDPEEAMHALDRKLDQGYPVGCQTGGYWLPYFPEAYRFHFNMHNIVVYGRRGKEYAVSDPIFPQPVTISRKDLRKARFAKGALAPKGRMYFIQSAPREIDTVGAIHMGIRKVSRLMLKSPLPIIGIRGIRFLANRLAHWPRKMGRERALLYLGQVIRMQEEIGTGGGGFRFMYSAFLQEAAQITKKEELSQLSGELTRVGDRWRDFAVLGARNCKGRATRGDTFPAMAEILHECAERERAIYKELLATV
ncbi:MAG: BtrH N-terminal domain-containing protein [Desulfohalobiaceae bacterium]|nr:BtrH N-terminal domain-containing protein [Desulfohalobiaceae bacterium]